MPHRRVLVVGGGVSGLATAWYLARAGADVTVLEAGSAPGGKIRTRPVAGLPVDLGPDAILARSAVVETLLGDLGLLDRISRPRSRRAFVWTGGRLRPLPPMSLFGVPDAPLRLVRTGILSPAGALRAAADVVLPRRRLPGDPTIAELLRPRFGAEVFDRLVDPMLGGVHAGRADRLSARSTVPEVHAVVARARSVYLALRRRPPAPGGARAGLGMVSLRGGLVTLVDALVATGPLDVRCDAAVAGVRHDGAAWRVTLVDGEEVAADDVVLATPAAVTAELLRPVAPAAAVALDDVPAVSVATVALAYRRSAVDHPLDGTGFLVPPADGHLLVGCTWSSAKWEHLSGDDAPDGVAVLRCSVGRDGDDRFALLDDAGIVRAVRAELAEAMGLDAEPLETLVRRWPKAMPQYTVGHANRLSTLDTRLAALPGLHVTGAAYRGVGIASCITQAERCASTVLARQVGGPVEPVAVAEA